MSNVESNFPGGEPPVHGPKAPALATWKPLLNST